MFEFHLQDKFDLADSEDTQFAVAPDDSIILHHRVFSEEVYAYDLGENRSRCRFPSSQNPVMHSLTRLELAIRLPTAPI